VPWVIAKAETDIHADILSKVGADRIVFPEVEAGVQVAHSLEIRHAVDYMNLTSTSGVARMRAPGHCQQDTVAKTEAAWPDISILLIQRGNLLLPRPAVDTTLHPGDIVLIAGLDEAIDAFADS
jgi:trk system potassium uptake protein TrkA